MNEKNLAALESQLEAIGLENQLGPLIRKICFQPGSFVLAQQLTKSLDRLSVQLTFERGGDGSYSLLFYEVALLQDTSVAGSVLNGVEISALDQEMQGIDWHMLFAGASSPAVRLDDKSSWESESRVDKIVTRLRQLSSTKEGEAYTRLLKAKYWSPAGVQATAASPRSEISQRFYPHPGGRNISVDEAWRFLQNKRLERQFQHLRKQKGDAPRSEGKQNQSALKRPTEHTRSRSRKGGEGSKS